MKHISILVPRGAASLGCIEGAFILFTKANDFLKDLGKPPLFNVQLVGLDQQPRIYDKLFTVSPNTSIGDIQQTNLIIIPAVNGEMSTVINDNKDFFPWIQKHYNAGSEIASLCVGSFLLAATGLLKGKKCSTHWMAANDFRKLFPDVELVSERIITDEQGLYSSGGANSFWNLLLYLLEKYSSRDLAIHVSKYYEIEIDRGNQSQFMIFQGQKIHEDETVRKAQDFIEQNYQERITVEQLTSMLAISRRSFERRFKKATSNTVVEYMQIVKMEAAKKGLEAGNKQVNELMYEVGYSDTKAFRSIFKRTTGLSPIEYRNKYNKTILTA
jgi:transcriptional regulator GlxA family with amidase domain